LESSISLILDIVVSLLLVATIIYAVRLNNRLGSLRRERKDLEAFTASFNSAVKRAESSISVLKKTADGLEDQVSRAQSLRDDLAFLMERGGVTADRLEEVIRNARKDYPTVSNLKIEPAVSDIAGEEDREDGQEPKSEAERELLRALQFAR